MKSLSKPVQEKRVNTPKTTVLLSSLLFIGFLLVFIQANAPSLDSDGIHYAAVAKEIARGGRWLYPFDPVISAPYYFHFPLSIWPTAFLFKLFGTSPAVAKLYSMLMTLGAVAGIFALGRILAGPWVGWFSGVAFLLTNHVLRIARQCRVDLPTIAFLVWAFVGLMLAQKRSRFWYLFMGLACLGAIMTKEVVGLVPLAVAVFYFILLRKWKELLHPLFWTGVYLAVMPVLWWIATEYNTFGNTLFSGYFRANFTHLMTEPSLSKPWYYYGWAILDKYGYLLPFALAGGWIALKRIRLGQEPRWLIVFLWALAFPLGFSLAQHKVHYYILPTYAATALLVGLACERWIEAHWHPLLVKGSVVLALVGAVVLACFPTSLHKSRYDLNVRIAPQIDAIVTQSPGEVIVVRQDVASLLYYSDQVSRVISSHHWPGFQDRLAMRSRGRRYVLIGHKDWQLLNRRIKSRWQILLDDGQRYFLKQEGRA